MIKHIRIALMFSILAMSACSKTTGGTREITLTGHFKTVGSQVFKKTVLAGDNDKLYFLKPGLEKKFTILQGKKVIMECKFKTIELETFDGKYRKKRNVITEIFKLEYM